MTRTPIILLSGLLLASCAAKQTAEQKLVSSCVQLGEDALGEDLTAIEHKATVHENLVRVPSWYLNHALGSVNEDHTLSCRFSGGIENPTIVEAAWDGTRFESGDRWVPSLRAWSRTPESAKKSVLASWLAPQPVEKAELQPVLSTENLARVCKATVAILMGQSPSIMKAENAEAGLARVSYNRPSDNKKWTNECRVDGDLVIWRAVDAFGSGTGAGRWRTDPEDEKIRYKIDGKKVTVDIGYQTETYEVN